VLGGRCFQLALDCGQRSGGGDPADEGAVASVVDAATAVCAAVAYDRRAFDAALAGGRWNSVNDNSVSPEVATHAWRSTALQGALLMRLPNGGCGFAISSSSDGEILRARTLGQLSGLGAFDLVLEGEANGVKRYAYCGRGAFPLVASIAVNDRRRDGARFVFSLYRSVDRAPAYCRPA
jgi:hypothetical protein